MTSRSGAESRVAQEELFAILSEDHELCTLSQDAFAVMNVEAFEKGFTKLLKSYCADLGSESNNDLEKTTVQFLKSRSKQHYITRRFCEAFGPEDNRLGKFAELGKQHQEKIPVLQAWLKDEYPPIETVDEEVNDRADESDMEEEYDYSNLRLVKDFLLGKSLTSLQINLRRFVSDHKDSHKLSNSDLGKKNVKESSDFKAPLSTCSQVQPTTQEYGSFESLEKYRVQANGKVVIVTWRCVSKPKMVL